MKKSIRKPLNWQDFESLCKMLWGEIWCIPDKIKKNGRLGQSQSGVDVYGVPKDKIQYSGIQCKGKDDYSNSYLTKKEIDDEIKKAKEFQPTLETFIFATTANKDVEIEEYIRIKDIESRKNGGFEILVYCWEDIADLIEVNHQTFNYYVLENQFKSNFEIDVTFADGSDTLTLNPKYKKIITKYALKSVVEQDPSLFSFGSFNVPKYPLVTLLQPSNVNHSWSSFNIRFKNTGSVVLEDFRLCVYPEKHKFRNLAGYSGGLAERISYLQYSPLYVYEDEPEGEEYAIYRNKDNAPLIQKDSRGFEIFILPLLEEYEMRIDFELLARDFNQEGSLTLKIVPDYEIDENTIWVDSEDKLLEDTIEITDIITNGSML